MIKKGYPIRRLLNSRISQLKVSPTVNINDISNQLIRENKKIYKFGLGQSPFPVPLCIQDALCAASHQKDYCEAQGLLKLRESVAEYHNIKNMKYNNFSTNFTSQNVIIGPGSKELIFLIQLSYYGELVLQSPCWVSYKPQAEMIGRVIRYIKSTINDKYKICRKDLKQYLDLEGRDKPRLLVLNYPSNPTGMTYNNEDLIELAAICSEYGVIVLSDEIYSSLNYNNKYPTISQYYPQGTIILDGISKWCGAGGYRLGYFVVPDNLEWLLNGIKCCASETFTSVSTPIQYAAINAYDQHFENEELIEYLSKSREILKYISSNIVDQLRSYNLDVLEPDGGFYVYPGIDKTKKGMELKEKILEYHHDEGTRTLIEKQFFDQVLYDTGVAVLSGYHFGDNAAKCNFRLSFVHFNGEKALENIMDKKIYHHMFEGVDKLGMYLNE